MYVHSLLNCLRWHLFHTGKQWNGKAKRFSCIALHATHIGCVIVYACGAATNRTSWQLAWYGRTHHYQYGKQRGFFSLSHKSEHITLSVAQTYAILTEYINSIVHIHAFFSVLIQYGHGENIDGICFSSIPIVVIPTEFRANTRMSRSHGSDMFLFVFHVTSFRKISWINRMEMNGKKRKLGSGPLDVVRFA